MQRYEVIVLVKNVHMIGDDVGKHLPQPDVTNDAVYSHFCATHSLIASDTKGSLERKGAE